MELGVVELYSPLAYQAERKRKNHSKQYWTDKIL